MATLHNLRSRRLWLWAGAGLALLLLLRIGWWLYPTDRTPKGAYYRIVTAVNRGDTRAIFPYVETRGQHAAFSIQGYSEKATDLVRRHYPEPEKQRLLARLQPLVDAQDGPGVFELYAQRHGWVAQLRKDLSGVANMVIEGDRATIETARGTRYPFRRRENGIWGLTIFTAQLVADAEKAARDYSVIQQAAEDYQAAEIDEPPTAERRPQPSPGQPGPKPSAEIKQAPQ